MTEIIFSVNRVIVSFFSHSLVETGPESAVPRRHRDICCDRRCHRSGIFHQIPAYKRVGAVRQVIPVKEGKTTDRWRQEAKLRGYLRVKERDLTGMKNVSIRRNVWSSAAIPEFFPLAAE
jgi:hypothetical protein